MGNTMQRRQFFGSLAGKSSQPPTAINSQTVEKSFTATHPPATLKATGTQSGIAAYAGAWTDKEMIHLLRRVMFGATKACVDQISGMSVSAAVDFLIDNPVQPSTTPLNVYTTGMAIDTGGVPFGNSWVDAGLPDPTDATIRNTLVGNRLTNSFKPWWMGQMITQKTHILEKMTLFWSNHFGTDNANNNRPKAIFQHYKILRTYGLANFKDLLKQVTIDPHMLYFLSGNNSYKTAPNENYGRELQELFTVGKGPNSLYTEDDVKAAARVLSGWVVTQSPTDGTYSSAPSVSRHDATNKQFSHFYGDKLLTGLSDASAEIDSFLDMILATDECAKYVVRRLYTWFVYYDITADVETNVISPLAAIFRSSNYNIPTVLKALFKSEHFFDALNFGAMIKSPVDLYVSMVRECGITLAASPVDMMYQHWKSFYDKARLEGQTIGDPPNVAGWAAYYEAPAFYELWMSASSIQTKATNLKAYSNAGVTVSGVALKIDSVNFLKQFPSSDILNPDTVVSIFIKYLLPVDDLTTDQKAAMKAFLVPVNENDSYWSNEWNRYLAAPATYYTEVKGILDQLMRPIIAMAEYYLY